MKHKWIWISSIVCALLLCAGLAAAASSEPLSGAEQTGFEFRNHVNWDDSVADMLAAEDRADDKSVESVTYGPYQNFLFTDLDCEGEMAEIGYGYYQDALVYAAIYYIEENENGFAARREAVAALYGQPTQNDRKTLFALLDVISMGGVDHNSVADFAGWLLDDGTRTYLLLADGEVYLFYLNEERILQIHAGDAQSQFLFNDQITWNCTPAEMLQAEQEEPDPEINTIPGTEYTVYIFTNCEYQGETVDYAYYYMGNQLMVAAYYYPNDTAADFTLRQQTVGETYGEPIETDLDIVAALFSGIGSKEDIRQYISQYAGWELADGTQICLLNISGDIALFYFNGSALVNADL